MTVLVASPAPQSPSKTRARALSRALAAASRSAPLLDVPTELGLTILELGIEDTPFSTLAAVSKAFSVLIATILYRHVVLDTPRSLSLFHRTTKSKTPDFLESHVKTIALAIEPWRFTKTMCAELADILSACAGARVVSVPRPGILATNSLSRRSLLRTLPSEVTIQSFDATPPFHWDSSSTSPAGHLASSLTHLRICEPGDAWHSPLSIISFFGFAPHLTHLALARRMDANIDNDQVFVDEAQMLLSTRPQLRMLVVRIFPSHWPLCFDTGVPTAESSIWTALAAVAEEDKRLIMVAAGLEGGNKASSWVHLPSSEGLCTFWERCRAEWQAGREDDF